MESRSAQEQNLGFDEPDNRWENRAAVSIVEVEVEVAEGNRGSGDSVIAKPAYHFQIRCLRQW